MDYSHKISERQWNHPDKGEQESPREAPDIDGSIFIENAPGLKPGDFIKVRIEQGFAYEVVASCK